MEKRKLGSSNLEVAAGEAFDLFRNEAVSRIDIQRPRYSQNSQKMGDE